MREKTRKLILSIFLAACIVALMAASLSYTLTNGRYTGGKLSEDSPYDDIIDFVGATKYTVSTPEELVNAIENGYSYIEIAEGAEDPFVINSDIADVASNLVLNVNGHSLVRNSRNPLINVQKNVSVVLVYDSESIDESTPEEDMGGFYNPVGSALQTSGGTLTVGAGIYESGPDVEPISSIETEEIADIFVRDGDRHSATGYKKADSAAKLPKLTEDVYFENDSTEGYLRNDTYLIYTEESNCRVQGGQLYVNCTENAGTLFSVESNVASCDFYYYYSIGTNADGTQNYAVVYGYNDVKSLAQTKNETLTGANGREADNVLVWPYAAIRSEAGNTFARGGTFQTHFGEDNTYCIYSAGGTMTVGGSATPEFSAIQSGVCIKMEEGQEDEAELRSAPSLTIDSGTFSSEIGDTIKMFGGKMNVKAGKFTKTGCKKGTGDGQIDNQTAIISLQGGTLTVNGTKSGDENAPVYSVTMKAGGGANGGTLQNVFGIRAVGGGEITTKGVSFDIYGDYSAGVLSYDGTINVGSDTLINVVQSENTTVLTSAGVSSEQASSEASGIQQEEDHPVNLTGNVTINSNGLGITARGVVNVTGKGVAVTTTRGTGIYVNNGEFNVEAGASILVDSTVLSGYSWATPPKSGTTDVPNNEPNIYNGVYVQGGSLVAEGTLNVTFTGVANESHDTYDALNIRSYAVRVEQAASGGDTQVTTEVTIAKGTITNSVGGGVYVGGGTVTLGDSKNNSGGPMIETTGTSFDSENTTAGAGNWKYYVNKTGGHAVEVNGGDLSVYNGLYKADLGNGILVRGGNARIIGGIFQGNDTQDYRDNYGGNLPAGPAAYYALKLLGGSVTTFGGTFGTYTDTTDDITTTHTAGGSSAFVTGVGDQAIANIYGGTFDVEGQAGFSVYQNVALTFTPNGSEDVAGTTLKGSSVKVSAATTAIAIENTTDINVSVTINGGTFESTSEENGNRDGIWYSNPYAKLVINQPEGQTTQISAKKQHGVRLVHAPNTTGGVTITGGTITGTQHGILYVDTENNGQVANVNDGLLISGGTITGTNGAGLYFAANPWQSGSPATNNVAIIGGTFSGVPKQKSGGRNEWYDEGAIGAATNYEYVFPNYQRTGLGEEIKLNDILRTHNGTTVIGFVQNTNYNGNNGGSIADTISGMSQLTVVI